MADTGDIVARCRKEFEEDSKHHDLWARKVDRWYRAYRGEYEDARQRAEWRSDVHPPYLLQIVDTLASGLSDPNPRWNPKPRPKAASDFDIGRSREGAKQLGWLLAYQRKADGMVLKQHAHRLQGLVAGLSVWKTYWQYEETVQTVRRSEQDPYTGERFEWNEEQRLPRRDDPCVDVVDVRDFIWPESAVSLETAPRLHHRVWMTWDRLKELEKAGYYKNVDQLKETKETAAGDAVSSREQDLFQTERTKGRIEVVEHWIDGGKRVVTIANQNVLLSDRPNPFRHGRYPFIACAPMPELFRIPGISIVEMVEDLQKMVWQLQRQRLDNLEIINNTIILVPDNVLAQDYVFAPGEQWLVEAKDNAPMALELPTYPVDVSLNAEQLLKSDIQGIPGASPALLGQVEQVEQTATEVSLMNNLAQRRLAKAKLQFTIADIRVGEQWIELNRQFLSEPRWIAVVGRDGDEGWELIEPDAFSDQDFALEVEQLDESLIRQERLAEATSRYQVALQGAAVHAAIGQPLNMSAFLDDILDAGGIEDKQRYYAAQPQPGGAMQPGQGQPQIGPGQPAPTNGVTAPQAADIASPSNEVSLNPATMMQRMLTMGGGPQNGG